MRRRRKVQDRRPDMTPMIDVTFLLLVFFIVTLSFRVLEGRLDSALPKGYGVNSGQIEDVEKLVVTILVAEPGQLVADPDAKGLYAYEGRRLRYLVGSHEFRELAALGSFLAQWPERDTPVSIDAKKGTLYGDVIPVVDTLLVEDFQNVAFAGSFEQDW